MESTFKYNVKLALKIGVLVAITIPLLYFLFNITNLLFMDIGQTKGTVLLFLVVFPVVDVIGFFWTKREDKIVYRFTKPKLAYWIFLQLVGFVYLLLPNPILEQYEPFSNYLILGLILVSIFYSPRLKVEKKESSDNEKLNLITISKEN